MNRIGLVIGVLCVLTAVALVGASDDGEAGKSISTTVDVYIWGVDAIDTFDVGSRADFYCIVYLADHNENIVSKKYTIQINNDDTADFNVKMPMTGNLNYGQDCYIAIQVFDADDTSSDDEADVSLWGQTYNIVARYNTDTNKFGWRQGNGAWSAWTTTSTKVRESGTVNGARAIIEYTILGDNRQDTGDPTSSHTLNPADPDGTNNWYRQDVTINIFVTGDNYYTPSECDLYIDTGSGYQLESATWSGKTNGEGTITVRYKAADPSGNIESTNSFTLYIDKTDPTMKSLNGPTDWVAGTTCTFSWTANADTSGVQTYYYKIDDRSPTTTTSTSVTLATPSDGDHTFYVKAVDNSGRVGSYKSFSFKVDKTEPMVTSVSAPDVWVTGATCTFSWQASDATSGVKSFIYRVDNGNPSETTTTSVSLPTPADGNHKFYVKAVDNAGLVGDWKYASFNVDRTAPTVGNLAGPADWVATDKVQFTWTGDDVHSGIDRYMYRVDNGAEQEGTSPLTIDTPSDGTHILYVKAVDKAGNDGLYASFGFKVDRSLPDVKNLEGPAGWVTSDQVTFTWSTSEGTSGIHRFVYRIDDGGSSDATSPLTIDTPTDGEHTIYVKAEDNAGNVGDYAILDFKVDRTGPEVKDLQGPDGWVASEQLTLTWESVDGQSGVTKTYHSIDDGSFSEVTSPLRINTPTGGSHTCELYSVDEAGNEGPHVTFEFSADRTLPSVTSAQLASGGLMTSSTSVILDASFKDDATGSHMDAIQAKVGSGDWEDHPVVNDKHEGTIPLSLTIPDRAGTVTIQLRAVDQAGNEGEVLSIDLEYDPTMEDVMGPRIYESRPSDGSETTEARPTISAKYSDETTGGNGVDTGSVSILVDGSDVTSEATITATGVTYTPSNDLAYDEHTVTLKVRDRSSNANEGSKTWAFSVVEEAAELVSIAIEPASLLMEVGDIRSLVVIGTDDRGGEQRSLDVSWMVEGDIGRMVGDTFEATDAGSGRVKATLGGLSASITVTVVEEIQLESIRLEPQDVEMDVGDSTRFTATCLGTDGDPIEGLGCEWDVTGGVGNIDQAGHFVATSEGSGTVTASRDGRTATAVVKVNRGEGPEPSEQTVLPGFNLDQPMMIDGDLGVKVRFEEAPPVGVTYLVRLDESFWRPQPIEPDGFLILDISSLAKGDHTLEVKVQLGAMEQGPESLVFTAPGSPEEDGASEGGAIPLGREAMAGLGLAVLAIIVGAAIMTMRRARVDGEQKSSANGGYVLSGELEPVVQGALPNLVSSPATMSSGASSNMERLEQLSAMKERDLITEDDYEKAKMAILEEMTR